jgi:hypothetical protein
MCIALLLSSTASRFPILFSFIHSFLFYFPLFYFPFSTSFFFHYY